MRSEVTEGKWYRAVYRELGTDKWETLRSRVYDTTAPPRTAITQHRNASKNSGRLYEYKLLCVDDSDWHEV